LTLTDEDIKPPLIETRCNKRARLFLLSQHGVEPLLLLYAGGL